MRGGTRYGAGRPARHRKVEQSLALDVRKLAKAEALTNRVLSWRWTVVETGEERGSISIKGSLHRLTLSYTASGVFVSEAIDITRTKCNYGGERVWFRCPSCRGRVALLYLRGGRFRCRQCHGLRYQSQSLDECGRSWQKQTKIERQLGPHHSRPKGMHQATHDRLLQAVWDCEAIREHALVQYAARLREQDW